MDEVTDEITQHEERRRTRRTRRWKRRARILAPIASLPLLLATLMLSVDIVEYRPEEPRTPSATKSAPAKAASRPTRSSFAAKTAIATSAGSEVSFFEQIKNEIDAEKKRQDAAQAPAAGLPKPTVGLP